MSPNETSMFFIKTQVGFPLQNSTAGQGLNGTIDNGETIQDEVNNTLKLYLDLTLRGTIGVVAVFGLGNNVVNMIVFFRLGLKDSMSVGLMALSFTDFLVTVLGAAGPLCIAFGALFPNRLFAPVTFQYVAFGWYRDTCFLISGWITTLLSVERCVCVVSPFRVKQIFTRMRVIIVIVLVYVINVAVHMPVYLTQWLAWKTVEAKVENRTTFVKDKMIVRYSDNRDEIQIYIDIVNGAILPFPSQAIVLISVIWMIYGLHASSKVRKSATEEDDNNKSKLSSRENKLVKVVLFLAIILTVCNIPRFMAVYAKQIFTDVSFGKKHAYIYSLMWNLAALLIIINSSVNIFVYLIVNSNYRQEFKKLFLGDTK